MTSAYEKRVLKSKLVNYYEIRGRRDISATDSPNIVLFSDSPLNPKSIKRFNSTHSAWSTRFGEMETRRILGQKRK